LQARALVISYVVVAVSAAAYWGLPFTMSVGYSYGYAGNPLLGDYVAVSIVAVFGLVLGPYFAAAALMPGASSVWVEASRLIHRHISIPFLGGVALAYLNVGSYAAFGLAGIPTVAIYVTFVVVATLIAVMANRRAAPSVAVPQPQP